ncbi:Hormone receptor domain [Popillia japonica]|uniref:Hormone receptor domain n=1 Tax=Popillia japonica TaxID=7064 RepID=A0AAW1L8G4_POPJA
MESTFGIGYGAARKIFPNSVGVDDKVIVSDTPTDRLLELGTELQGKSFQIPLVLTINITSVTENLDSSSSEEGIVDVHNQADIQRALSVLHSALERNENVLDTVFTNLQKLFDADDTTFLVDDISNEALRDKYSRVLRNIEDWLHCLFCKGLFDGWTCWPDTPAGKDASQPCPDFIVGFDPNRTAYRRCEEDGKWFFHIEYNKTWSNYTTCVNLDELWFRQLINFIYSVGYSVSLVALIISLALFSYFK